jgi:hypothetical protein
MANTVTQRTLVGSGADKHIFRLIHIVSDGSEETDLVVYDNSALCADTSKGVLEEVWASGSTSIMRLEWDQTTDSPAISLDPSSTNYLDFRPFGGIGNPNGSGATGDLVLTTANLDSADEVTLILHIRQN